MRTPKYRSHAVTRRTALQAGAAGVGVGASLLAGIRMPGASATQHSTPVASPETTFSDRVSQAVDALDGLITTMMETSQVPGLSVAVVYDDEIVLASGYGVTSTETQAPVNEDTIFQIASLSKSIASTVVASIVGDGLVDWDTRLVEHLPGFTLYDPWITNQVTMSRHVVPSKRSARTCRRCARGHGVRS